MSLSAVSVERMTTNSNSLLYHCIRCNLFNFQPLRKLCGPSPVIVSDVVTGDKFFFPTKPTVGRDGEWSIGLILPSLRDRINTEWRLI